jgi:hypothetical protein
LLISPSKAAHLAFFTDSFERLEYYNYVWGVGVEIWGRSLLRDGMSMDVKG